MADNTATTTDAPLDDRDDERDAIRDAIDGTDLYVLTYFGGDENVFLVQRDSPPATEYPADDERIIGVDWVHGEDWALSVFRADEGAGHRDWTMVDDIAAIVDSRTAAVEKAAELMDAEYDG